MKCLTLDVYDDANDAGDDGCDACVVTAASSLAAHPAGLHFGVVDPTCGGPSIRTVTLTNGSAGGG